MNKIKSDGLTLIDVVVTLSVAAIVMSVAVPSYNTMTLDSRRSTTINRLIADLNLARSEAVKRGVDISICKTEDGVSCNSSINREGWSSGWIVFLDENGDGTSSSGEKLKVFQESGSFYSWEADFDEVVFSYQSNGFNSNNMIFTYCDKRGSEYSKKLTIMRVGRPRLGDKGSGVCSG